MQSTELPLDGSHPGPLFGPLAIRRLSTKGLRSRYYRRKVALATPPWASRSAIRQVYREAKALTKATGVLHSVDHIIPLRGELVWGLHVEYNLRVVPHTENMRKGNTCVDQLEMF